MIPSLTEFSPYTTHSGTPYTIITKIMISQNQGRTWVMAQIPEELPSHAGVHG